MRTLYLFLIVLFSGVCTLQAQRNEIGVMIGTANLISDYGNKDFIQLPVQTYENDETDYQFFASFIYKRNLNPRFSLRGQLSYARVVGDDSESGVNILDNAAASNNDSKGGYVNNIFEAAALFEYNFFDFNNEQRKAFSPFLFAGIAGFVYQNRKYSDVIFDTSGELSRAEFEPKYDYSFAIPFGAGLKYKFNYKWVLQLETGFRPTFQDDLDFSNPSEEDVDESGSFLNNGQAADALSFGQAENNDWYVFTGVGLFYTFGRPKCYRN